MTTPSHLQKRVCFYCYVKLIQLKMIKFHSEFLLFNLSELCCTLNRRLAYIMMGYCGSFSLSKHEITILTTLVITIGVFARGMYRYKANIVITRVVSIVR